MKKVSGILMTISLMFIIGLFSLSGCSSSGNKPGETVKKGAKLLFDKKYEAAVKLYVKNDGEKLTEEEKAKLMGMMPMALKEKESKQGLKDVEIMEETISEDGKTATVKYKMIFNNGDTDDERTELINIDGDWYMVIGK